ncbi:hypothetical protein WCE37_11875 [Luteimonas sp. MJ250]|uniref:hypothetical protein n=1 Tax=Luteimonas sp. MJ250 TaxID=3129236 RepID=UPI0031BA900C
MTAREALSAWHRIVDARRARACRWAVAAVMLAGVSCGHALPANESPKPPRSPEVIQVADAEYGGTAGDPLEAACGDWRLSGQQVAEFFQLSRQYEQLPYSEFYQLPCSISGKLRSEGGTWDFVIGGGGTATWSRGGQTRYFGCSAEACAPLVLLHTDLMDPE